MDNSAKRTLPTSFSTFHIQKRLRHLKCINARNIQFNDKDTEDTTALQIYFTLHTSLNEQEFYTSEKIQGSINPSWKTFNLDRIPLNQVNTTTTAFVLKLWIGRFEFVPVTVWQVNLTGLIYLGDKLQKELIFPPNTVLFGMHNGFYIAPEDKSVPLVHRLGDYTTVDQGTLRKSYNVSALARVQTVLRAIKQTDVSGTSVRSKIENKLSQSMSYEKKKASVEDGKTRIKQLSCDLEWRTRKLQREKERYETKQTMNIQRDMYQQKRYDTLKNDRARLHERKKKYFDVREELIKNGAQLVMRRKQLISELSFIYPIRELPNTVFKIAGVTLPNSTEFQGSHDTLLEVALGYTCHLVHMISHFLDMPLRYPMEHRGSKSLITDHILDKLGDKERDFPVFSKGREKFQFEYGVYLLNKNIAQLRYYCGLGTTDLRLTLPNLKTLLQLRLGVKFDHFECYEDKSVECEAVSSPPPKSIHQLYSAHTSPHQPATEQQCTVTVVSASEQNSSPKPDADIHSSDTDNAFHTQLQDQESSNSSEVITRSNPDQEHFDNMQTLGGIMKEKLLGPINNFHDVEVSSSEDSANAVYGSKIWPRMLDNMAVKVNDDSDCEGSNEEGSTVNNGKTTISDTVNNENKTYSDMVNNKKTIFSDTANNDIITFSDTVNNEKTTFSDTINTRKTIFNGSDTVNNEKTTLSDTINTGKATFSDTVNNEDCNDSNVHLLCAVTEDNITDNTPYESENTPPRRTVSGGSDSDCSDRQSLRRAISEVETGEGLTTLIETEAAFVDFSPTFKTFHTKSTKDS